MDAPTAVTLAAAAGLAVKTLADLAARRLDAERARLAREMIRGEGAPPVGDGEPAPVPPAPAAPKLAP